jgi:hypothetical protein
VPDTPFDGIEGALEYIHLLADAIDEAQVSIRQDMAGLETADGSQRRLQAMRIVDYKLGQLRAHVGASSRILNDLRTLRRLLLGEREDG